MGPFYIHIENKTVFIYKSACIKEVNSEKFISA